MFSSYGGWYQFEKGTTNAVLMHENLNMAFKVIILAVLCLIATHCAAEPTQCSKAVCKVLPVEDVAFKFKLLASEKGVRMIYLNLKIGNDTYHPLELKDEFLPWRWVWAKSISEPMLSLPYDYDILSLGLLNYQVRSITIQLQDYPNGCLNVLNHSSCQDEVIGRALLRNVTKGNFGGELQREGEVVCVAFVDTGIKDFFDGNVVFQCCGRDNQAPEKIRCEQPIKRNSWHVAFTYVLNVLTIALIFYCPALPLALPSSIFDLWEEIEKEKLQESAGSQVPPDRSEYNSLDQSLLYLDDACPITCSTLLGKCGKYIKDLLDFRLAFNFKLAFLWYCVIPFFFYVKLGLTLILKSQFFEETSNKNNASLVGPLFSVIFAFQTPLYFYVIIMTLIVLPFVTIIFLGPEDFSFSDHHHVDLKKDLVLSYCCICNRFMPSVGLDMLRHMEILKAKVFKLANQFMGYHRDGIALVQCCTKLFEKLIVKPCKRLRRAMVIVITCLLVFPSVIFLLILCGLVWGVICFCAFLVLTGLACLCYSPLVSLCCFSIRKWVQIEKVMMTGECCLTEILDNEEPDGEVNAKFTFLSVCCTPVLFICVFLVIIFLFLLFGWFLIASFVVSLSCRFVVRMIGFVIMGLVLNAEIASPFVTFFLAVSTNMFLCYYNLQGRYKEVKKMISKHWKQLKRPETSISVVLSNSRQDTIPEGLFWHVCNEKSKSTHNVLPITREICCMLGKMTLILIFLFLSLCSVIFLGNSNNIPSVASTIAVFLSGIIPGLFFKGLINAKKFSGAKKEEMMGEIELAVKEYVREMEQTGTDTSAAPVNRQDIELTEYDMV